MIINVVIPAYNAEDTIERAINSALELTVYVNTRVIVVDDGSTDRTCSLVKKYKKRVVLLKNKGKGVSSARNTGLRFLTSEDIQKSWVTFLDADDLLIKDAFIEFATGKYDTFEYVNFCFNQKSHFGSKTISSEKASYYAVRSLKNYIYNFNSPWGRIINLDFIKKHNINFDENLSYKEDMLFNIQCFRHNPKIIVLQSVGYQHTNNSGSVINNFVPSALNDEQYIFNEVKKMFGAENKLEEIEKLVGTVKLTFVYVFPKNMGRKLLNDSKNRFWEVRNFLGKIKLIRAFKELDGVDFAIITLYKLGLYNVMKLLFKMKGRI